MEKLTNSQKSIWVTEQFYRGSSVNTICGSAIIDEKIDFENLEKSIQIVCKKHDNFKLRLKIKDGEVYQDIVEENTYVETIKVTDEKEFENFRNRTIKVPIDLNSQLFKFYIFKFENGKGAFMLNIHHLISDGWTLALICNDIIKTYSALINNQEIETKAIYSYIDYINSEKEYLNSEKYEKDKKYWKEKYKTIPEIATIPGSKKEENKLNSVIGERKQFEINKEQVDKLKKYCKENGISLYNFFMAVYAIYLSEISNLDDFVIGTPILNRTNFKEKNAAGMFINMAPLRINLSGVKTFKEFVQNIAIESLGMLKHQKYSYQSLLEELRKDNKNMPSLYNVLISYQITNAQTQEGNIKYKTEWTFNGCCAENMDIQIYDLNDTGNLNIAYDYKVSIYEGSDIEKLHKRIVNIITQVIQHDDIEIKNIEIVTPKEKQRLLFEFNNTELEYDKTKPIIKYFEEQVEKTPEKIAVVCNNKKITYKELNERANMLSNKIKSIKHKEKDIIGIMMTRSIEMIVGIIAILKSGSAYLPIDPEYPIERIKYMISDSKTNLILVNNKTESIKTQKCISLNVDDKTNYNVKYRGNSLINTNYDDTVYLIYTSGSTGNPKGVIITNKNLSNFFYGMKQNIDFNKNKNMVSVTTICFDIFGLELWCSLLSGMSLILANEEEQNSPVLLNQLCLKNNANIIQTTPSRFSVIFENKDNLDFMKNITELLVGGEPLGKRLLTKIKENTDARIFNMYGPTETTIWSTMKELTHQDEISIGKPISNTKCYVLNKNHKLLPVGIKGELYIGGDGVSKGYLNRNELNSEKFILSPFNKNEIIYNTNDLAYIKNNGDIIHLGRTDSQVKIRGFRIELGEIEKIIEQNQNIIQVVVIKSKLKNGHDGLIAYYIANNISDHICFENELREKLKKKLPQYMIPQYFISLKSMPYTPNGKIDRKALPEPVEKEENKGITKPRNEIDEELIKLIKNMLYYEDISITDTLLDLGGDSLTGITLSTKILSKYNVLINIKDILSNFSIKDMSDYIAENKKEGNTTIKIPRIPEAEFYPLSSAQRRIYYNSKMIGEDNIVYNMPGAVMINGLLVEERVKEALNKIIERHEILRTRFIINDNTIMQKVIENIKIDVPVFYNKSDEIYNILKSFSKPFHLEEDLLIRAEIHYIDNKKTLLLFDSHHIIMDGTGLNNLIIEFNRIYNGDNLKKLPIQYRDYSDWEQKFNESEKIKKLENYWVNKFNGSDFEQLNLPYDYKQPRNRTYRGETVSKIIDEKIYRKVERFAKRNGVSPYILFLTAFFILLYKYTGQNDINIGSPMANRNLNETKRMIGMFVNNIVIRGKVDSNKTFKEFLDQIKDQVLDDLSYQPYPFDLLVKKLNIPTDPSRNPLFDVMLTYQNREERTIKIDDKESEIIELNNHIAKFNLSVEIKPETHTVNIEYCTDLFKKQTIERFFDHYVNVIKTIINDVDILIKDISIISEQEKKIILRKFNKEKYHFNNSKTIIKLFKEQVKKNPKVKAVKYKEKQITYLELDKKSNYIATQMINQGIKQGDVVGIYLNRSIELIIYMLATMKIGAIYMPMYINYPLDRLEYMLENSNAKLLITDGKTKINFNGMIENVQSYEEIQEIDKLPNIEQASNPEKIAYIIYTSGSTGRPKGVQIRDRNLVNFVKAFNKYYEGKIGPKDKFLATTNISFDVSMWEIFMALLNGSTLVLYEHEIITDIVSYVESIEKNKITSLYIPPNILEEVYILLRKKENIKINKILVGVEPIRKRILNKYYKLNQNMIIVNGYGPTETTICCTALKYQPISEEGIVSIGKPLKNNKIYILSNDKNIQPMGIPGEIYVTGAGVGAGYINKKVETEKNFLDNILDKDSEKMYKTGDIAKWNKDGTINFIGRNDSQVKISGHRIELSEINHAIMEYPGIIKSYTTTNKRGERTYIVSYYIAEKEIVLRNLNTFLKEKLAEYAIPNYIIQLDKFPLTPNGKIDKEKLPTNFLSKAEYIEPRDEFEQKLSDIFKKIFMIKKVGIDDNFFDLGGDSLTAIKFQIEALNQGLKITYADIFSKPTIRKLSEDKNKKIDYKVDTDYNFNEINKIISKNNISEIKENKNDNNIKNVLLIGSTGFLGIHILEQLILNKANKIYCIIREKSSVDPITRLKNYIEFYFGGKYSKLIGDKIIVIDGDITDKLLGQKTEEKYQELAQNVDCVIHTAAIVKHYGNLKKFKDTNIEGTENVANFCKKFNKKLYYISTLSVSGNILKNSINNETIDFKENQFYIGQDLNNVYVYTKFEAEKRILEKIKNGLDACILRVGNITNRYSDGKFQINVSENAFLNRIKSIIKLGVVQEQLLEHSLEFTPVDFCAKAIVKVVKDNTKFTILHIFNHNFIKISKIIDILNQLEEKIVPVNDDEFKKKINLALKDKELKSQISGILTDLDENKQLNLINDIIPNSDFTKIYLQTLGFKWPKIDEEYIKKYINYFKALKYI